MTPCRANSATTGRGIQHELIFEFDMSGFQQRAGNTPIHAVCVGIARTIWVVIELIHTLPLVPLTVFRAMAKPRRDCTYTNGCIQQGRLSPSLLSPASNTLCILSYTVLAASPIRPLDKSNATPRVEPRGDQGPTTAQSLLP